jgi:glycosyl hydrolase family 113
MKPRHTVHAVAFSALFFVALAPAATPPRMRGVCWEGAGRIDATNLAPLRDLGVDWISQTPFGWAPSLTSNEIRYRSDGGLWGETDAGLVQTAAWAHALGIKTFLKPHVWVRHGEWPGDIAMVTDDAWKEWFASYEAFILHYARLAEANGFESLAVGTELGKTTARTADWKRIVARVRQVYHGKLTYCANWNDEAERVAFWDDLDFIGVQAYYPLTTVSRPSKDEIEAAWAPVVKRLEALAKRTGKPIVFTEVGFKSHEGSLKEPWRWETDGAVDFDLQRDAYTAMFETFWRRAWFGGSFVWKWHPSQQPYGRDERDFTPQGKPALSVIKAYYTGR